jgi:hypothetical protein
MKGAGKMAALSYKRVALLAGLIIFAAGWGLAFYPLGYQPPNVSAQDGRLAAQILAETGDDMRLRFISQVKFSGVETISTDEQVFHFTSYTFGGIAYTKARVFVRNGQIMGGEVISARSDWQ